MHAGKPARCRKSCGISGLLIVWPLSFFHSSISLQIWETVDRLHVSLVWITLRSQVVFFFFGGDHSEALGPSQVLMRIYRSHSCYRAATIRNGFYSEGDQLALKLVDSWTLSPPSFDLKGSFRSLGVWGSGEEFEPQTESEDWLWNHHPQNQEVLNVAVP